jgi:hypothetical protein
MCSRIRAGRSRIAWKPRLSYSAQGDCPTDLPSDVALVRTVAGVAGEDRWRVSPVSKWRWHPNGRFDYPPIPICSAHGGHGSCAAAHVHPRAGSENDDRRASRSSCRRNGEPWLPAEQLFFPLSARGTLEAEELRRADVGVAYQLRAPTSGADAPTLHLRRFWEQSTNQMATLFNGGGGASRGQYAVAPVGSVDLPGMGIAPDYPVPAGTGRARPRHANW